MERIITGRIHVRILPGRVSMAMRKLRGFLRLSPREPLEYESAAAVTCEWSFMLDDMIWNGGEYMEVGTEGTTLPVYPLPLPCAGPVGTHTLEEGYPNWDWDEREGIGCGTITYRADFPPGTVKLKRGRIEINEVSVCPAGPPEVCLVYGLLEPALPVRAGDTLRITVEVFY